LGDDARLVWFDRSYSACLAYQPRDVPGIKIWILFLHSFSRTNGVNTMNLMQERRIVNRQKPSLADDSNHNATGIAAIRLFGPLARHLNRARTGPAMGG